MSDIGIGKLITGEAHRDAIHIAVAPVTAALRLMPGQEVDFLPNGKGVAAATPGIGIVDPFLAQSVEPGQSFYLFLHPGSITSLRHDWSHPSFHNPMAVRPAFPVQPQEDSWRTSDVLALCRKIREEKDYAVLPILADALEEAGCEDGYTLRALRRGWYEPDTERIVALLLGGELASAVRWLDDFAREIDITYNGLMDAASRWLACTQENKWDGYTCQDGSESWRNGLHGREKEFWTRYEVVTGKVVEDKTEQFFNCSC